MTDFEHKSFNGDRKHRDRYLPYVDFEILAANTSSTSLDWGATPLNFNYDERLKFEQDEVHEALRQRTLQVPEGLGDIPPEIQSYVELNFLSRFEGRRWANYNNYSSRLRVDEEFTASEEEIFEKAMWGRATPAELLYTRYRLGMASIELGCITHPYGTHTDKLEEMQDSVRDAMSMFGARPLQRNELQNVFAVKRADNLSGKKMSMYLRDAFVVTRKRDYGQLSDGTVVRERSSFVVRIDAESDFDQKIAANMRKVPLIRNEEAMKHLAFAGRINEIIPPLIRDKVFGTVIPLSTTMYAFNRETLQHIKARDTQLKEEKRRAGEADRQRLRDADTEDAARTFGNNVLGTVNRES